ncbi:MAG: oligoendopeptidase F, partial [Pseudolabrys sp.]|nr:oligoendopeptidase F [Pseudolabrys sp.]
MARTALKKKSAARKSVKPKAKARPAQKPAAKARLAALPKLGDLPDWNLNDLYPGIESTALKQDLSWIDGECIAFEELYKGKLGAIAAQPGASEQLCEAVKRYEKIGDVLGRIGSYAGLLHAGNSTDAEIAKFYGDMNERITTAYSHLLFFDLELNRVDDKLLDTAMAEGPLAHYRPWIEDVRKEKPYQLE